jgi:hypothetical protein
MGRYPCVALAVIGLLAVCWNLFWHGANAAKMRRILGDVILVSVSVGFAALFLWQNGFIGNGEIQPYPY